MKGRYFAKGQGIKRQREQGGNHGCLTKKGMAILYVQLAILYKDYNYDILQKCMFKKFAHYPV